MPPLARCLPSSGRMTRTGVHTLSLLLILLATPSFAMAADSITDSPRRPIRTTDRRLRMLLQEGVRTSPTLRALVEHLQTSDVVVYLNCDGVTENPTDGRLSFVSSAGGYRYIVIRMTRLLSPERQIALMAHELQHAVEIANAREVVDEDSLLREYRRIGYVNPWSTLPGIAFDTHAAVQAGTQVLKEMMND
jgi:hypothetical protein